MVYLSLNGNKKKTRRALHGKEFSYQARKVVLFYEFCFHFEVVTIDFLGGWILLLKGYYLTNAQFLIRLGL